MPRRIHTRWPLAAVFAVACLLGPTVGSVAAEVGGGPTTSPAPSVSGRLVGEAGRPLSGATVSLRPIETLHAQLLRRLDDSAELPATATAKTAADGRFRLEAPGAGMWELSIEAAGRSTARVTLIPLLEPEELGDLDPPPTDEVRVAVRDPAGRPVAGAIVEAREAGGPWTSPGRALAPVSVRTRTGADGTVVVHRAVGAKLHVAASLPGGAPGEPVEATGRSLTVTLAPTQPRTVRIESAVGAAVPGAVVASRSGEITFPLGATGEEGTLAVLQPVGGPSTQLVAYAVDGRTAEVTLAAREPGKAPAAERDKPVAIRLEPEARVAGRTLRTSDRRAVADAWVWPTADPARTSRSGPDGGFTLPAPPSGWIAAVAVGFGAAWVKPPEGANAILLLPAYARFAGRVIDEEENPVADVEVAAYRERQFGRPPTRARSDRQGRFALRVAAGERFVLRAEPPGWAPTELAATAPDGGATKGGLEIVLRRGRTVVGRAVDEGEEAVQGASVRLVPSIGSGRFGMSRPIRREGGGPSADSAADGSFRISDLGGGRYDLVVTGSGYAPAIVPGVEVPDGSGATDLGTVVLSPGQRIGGRVVDLEGRPIEGAQITYRHTEMYGVGYRGTGDDEPPVVSALDGWFEITDLAAGRPVDLDIERSGYSQETVAAVIPPVAEPLRVILRPTVTLRGRVTDADGRAVPDAVLWARTSRPMFGEPRPRRPGRGPQVQSGEDGRFEIADVEPGEVTLSASAKGFRPAELGGLQVAAGRDLDGIRVELEPGAVVTGRVTGADGEPLAEANVQVEEPRETPRRGRPVFTRTDAEGRYTLEGVGLGRRTLAAYHEPHVRGVRDLEVGPGDNRADFRLERGASVAGRVLDEGGAPVPGARVSLVQSAMMWSSRGETTDDDGRFTVEGVEPGRYLARAEAEGFAPSLSDPVVVAGSIDGLELRLARGAAIVGRVVGVDPDDLPAVQIHANSVDGGQSVAGAVDFEGRFRLDGVSPGSWDILGSRGLGGRIATAVVEVEPGVPEVPVILDFTGGYTVEGEILSQGETVSGLWVTIVDPGARRGGIAISDQQGRFRIEGLERGDYELTVARVGTAPLHQEAVRIDGDRALVVEIEPASISGRVVDRADGTPVAAATLELHRAAPGDDLAPFGRVQRFTSGRDGTFLLPAVGPGSYTLVATADGYQAGQRALEVAAGGELADLQIEIARSTAEAELLVRSGTGSRPDDVWVAVLPLGAGEGSRPVAGGAFPIGAEGRVRVPGLASGTWRVWVGALGHAPVAATVTLPGPPVAVTLPLPATLTVNVPALREVGMGGQVRLRDPTGELLAQPLFGDLYWSIPVRTGRGEITNVPPGAWTVVVTAPDGRTWTGQVTLGAGGSGEMVLEGEGSAAAPSP